MSSDCKVIVFSCKEKDYKPYDKLENVDSSIVVYKSLFSNIINYNRHEGFDYAVEAGLANITLKAFSTTEKKRGILAVVLIKDMIFKNETYEKGSLFIFGNKCTRINPNNNLRLYYEINYLPEVYRTLTNRLSYIDNSVNSVNSNRHKTALSNTENKLIGKGSFANVYSTYLGNNMAVLKISKVKEEAYSNPYSHEYASWHEINILTEIAYVLIKNKICPNLPLVYSFELCPRYSLKLDGGRKKKYDCISIATELANGNLKEWFNQNEKRTDSEVYSALFQILYALHCIQYYAQIMNYDIKKENILYYKIIPGGYWKYVIKNRTYYVPNHGFLFVLTDFGVSRPMSPLFKFYKTPKEETFRLGHRYAYIKNHKFIPFTASESKNTEKIKWSNDMSSNGLNFEQNKKTNIIGCDEIILTKEDKSYFQEQGLSSDTCSENFFINSDIIPPFEFYNDTQDAIKMLIGGKRSTQEGRHKAVKLSKEVQEQLSLYKGKKDNMSGNYFSTNPAQVCAGELIRSLFPFFEKENKPVIETYRMKKLF